MLKAAMLHPGLEPFMYRGLGGIVTRNLAPLAARSGQPDQGIEDGAAITRWPPTSLPGFVDHEARG